MTSRWTAGVASVLLAIGVAQPAWADEPVLQLAEALKQAVAHNADIGVAVARLEEA